jgi:hypothetical protein
MTTLTTTPINKTKREQADRVWRQLLDQALRRGFHGTAAIEVSVQDGTIQNIRRKVEQMEK